MSHRGILWRAHSHGSQRLPGGARGDWWASYYCALGHRHRQKVGSKTLAAEEHGRLRRKVRFENYCPDQAKRTKPVTLRDFSKKYVTDYAKVSKTSWKTDEYRLKKVLPLLGDRFLSDLGPQVIEQYRAARLEAGRARGTINREVALVAKMLSVAVASGAIPISPLGKVSALQEAPGRTRYLLPAEATALLEACDPVLRPMVVTALHTGLRKDRMLGLTWGQVNLRDRMISVPPTKRGRPVHVPINDLLLGELRRLPRSLDPTAYMFTNPETKTRYHDVPRRPWRAALTAAKLTGFRWHDLRHTAGTYFQAATGDVVTTQKLLGHADVRMTLKYAHVSDDRLRQAVAGLQTALASGGSGT